MPQAEVLVLDATSIACQSLGDPDTFVAYIAFLKAVVQPNSIVAIFDPKSDTVPKARQLLDPHYLKRRNLRQQPHKTSAANFEEASSSSSFRLYKRNQKFGGHHSVRRPLLQHLAVKAGCRVAVPAAAFEADDLIACVCQDLSEGGVRVVVASSDSDCSAMLDTNVSWLRMAQATLAWPLQCQPVTAESFEASKGYLPRHHRALLALCGKKEAGIRGIGLSSATAHKLLNVHGSVEGIVNAAEAGELANRSSRTDAVFGSKHLSSTTARLRHNWTLFRACRDPEMVTAAADLSAAALAQQNLPRNRLADPGHAVQLAWLHPRNHRHWSEIATYAKALSSELHQRRVPHLPQHALPIGLVIDVAIPDNQRRKPSEDALTALLPSDQQEHSQQRDTSRLWSSPGLAILLVKPLTITAHSEIMGRGTALQGWRKHHQTLLRRAGWNVVVIQCNASMEAAAEQLVKLAKYRGSLPGQ